MGSHLFFYNNLSRNDCLNFFQGVVQVKSGDSQSKRCIARMIQYFCLGNGDEGYHLSSAIAFAAASADFARLVIFFVMKIKSSISFATQKAPVTFKARLLLVFVHC
jgi:hypothetical protein